MRMDGDWLPSAKAIAVKAQILQWQRDAPDDKIIIFTQFLMMYAFSIVEGEGTVELMLTRTGRGSLAVSVTTKAGNTLRYATGWSSSCAPRESRCVLTDIHTVHRR
jgi:hypothetical protein